MERKFAEYLLEINAVSLQPTNPFTWSSGMKSPIYCDNRIVLSYPQVRKHVELGLANLMKKLYPDADFIMGTATAGIAHAALVANILDLPMGYVRGSAKEHGKQKRIEGDIKKGQKVVVIEDLISTGESAIQVVNTLRDEGISVLGVISIFTYQLEIADTNFKIHGIDYDSLTNYQTLIEVALEKSYVNKYELDKLIKWRKNPNSTEWMD